MAALVVTLTRREVLTTFLGAAIACRKREPREPLPPGDLVGASASVGHRLREHPARIAPSHWETHDVVIVGAGAAGLAAAWRLAKRDVRDVVIFELEPAIGGTARSGSSRISAYPWGAHYVPSPAPNNTLLIELLREMGVMEGDEVAEQFLCRDPDERLWYRGRWYEGLYLYAGASAEDLRQLHAFEAEIARWVAWRDAKGRRAFAIPTALGSDDAEVTALDAMSMEQWLAAHRFTSPRLRWLVEYACRDDYGSFLRDTSAWAGVFYFASRVDKPRQESRGVITWPEGNGALIAHLAKSARDVRKEWLVANLAPSESGVDVIALRGGEAIGVHAKHVIFAAPQFLALHVIEPWRDAPPPHVREFEYGSWMVANLTLRDRPAQAGFPLAWDNVIYDSPSLGYVVATHQRGIERGPTVLTYYFALCDRNAREHLLRTGRDEWADVVLTDLARPHPEIRTLCDRLDVMRWGHAMIRPRPHFVWSAARRAAAQPFRNIHFANTDLSGVALFEEALWHGARAADEVAGPVVSA
ncbi:MAG TPA: FAD-dependent oxidoreductase [Thermoanaerobaculia bacterium]|nr:FAD-dependent oxidoreductase [Thermoanaerobaculia bacterium]